MSPIPIVHSAYFFVGPTNLYGFVVCPNGAHYICFDKEYARAAVQRALEEGNIRREEVSVLEHHIETSSLPEDIEAVCATLAQLSVLERAVLPARSRFN